MGSEGGCVPKCVRIEWDNKLQFMLAVIGYAVGLGESSFSVCPSVCLSACLSVCPSVCLSVCMSVCMFVCSSVCLPVFVQMRQN